MPLPTTEERLGSPQRIVRFFVLIMALVYIALGAYLWYTASQPTPVGVVLPLGHRARYILGGVLVLYGVYRLVRTIRTQFSNTPPDELS